MNKKILSILCATYLAMVSAEATAITGSEAYIHFGGLLPTERVGGGGELIAELSNSGSDVANETMIIPMIHAEIPKLLAMSEALSTVKCAPMMTRTNPPKSTGMLFAQENVPISRSSKSSSGIFLAS